MKMDATSCPKWSRQAEPTVIEWVNTSKCHKHVLNTRCSQVGNTTESYDVQLQKIAACFFDLGVFGGFWIRRFRTDLFGVCTCHALVPLLHHPRFPNIWDYIRECEELQAKIRPWTIGGTTVVFKKPQHIKIRQ